MDLSDIIDTLSTTASTSLDQVRNCSLSVENDYCEPVLDYVARIEQHLLMGWYEWMLVVFYVVVFTVGLVGNGLVIGVVLSNLAMRTVTNVFLVNLAVADFLVILLCMPPTLVEDIRQTWYFGAVLCKLAKFMQHVSITVSVLTLTVISFERWQAICRPFHVRRTRSRACCLLAAVWVIALTICLPQWFSMKVERFTKLPADYLILSECKSGWSTDILLPVKYVEMTVLFFIPFLWMGIAYAYIIQELWCGVHLSPVTAPASQSLCDSKPNKVIQCRSVAMVPRHASRDKMGPHSVPAKRAIDSVAQSAEILSHRVATSNRSVTDFGAPSSQNGLHAGPSQLGQLSDNHMRKRRRAASMLMLVVGIFFISYLPVHLLEIIRTTVPQKLFDDHPFLAKLLNSTAKVLHLLCFINSAINPIIYNLMSLNRINRSAIRNRV